MSYIIHLDVRPENILITNPEEEYLNFKLCDFGLSEPADAKAQKRRNTLMPLFRMPEIFIGSEYSFSADIWSLGVTVIETILGFDKTFAMKKKSEETLDKQIVSSFLIHFGFKYKKVLFFVDIIDLKTLKYLFYIESKVFLN